MSSCNICFGRLDGEIYSCPHCQNNFHRDHIAAWLLIQSFCPVCRAEMPMQVLQELAPRDQADINRLMAINRRLDSMTRKVARWERKDKKKNRSKYKRREREMLNSYEPPEREPSTLKQNVLPVFLFIVFMVFVVAINN